MSGWPSEAGARLATGVRPAAGIFLAAGSVRVDVARQETVAGEEMGWKPGKMRREPGEMTWASGKMKTGARGGEMSSIYHVTRRRIFKFFSYLCGHIWINTICYAPGCCSFFGNIRLMNS